MKNKELLQRLNSEFNNIEIPDVLDKVRANSSINVQKTEKKRFSAGAKRALAFSFAAIILLAVFIPMQIFVFSFDTTASATVTMDINPSIELKVNSSGKVVSATGIGSDGIALLQELTLKRKTLEEAVELILSAAEESGYENTTVLYGVTAESQEEIDNIKAKLSNGTNNYYGKRHKNGNIVWADESGHYGQDSINNEAAAIGISPAKLALIYEVIEAHPEYEIEDLKDYSIGELRRLLR